MGYKTISVKDETKQRFNGFMLWFIAETGMRNVTEDDGIRFLLNFWVGKKPEEVKT